MQSIRSAVFHRPARGRAPVAHPARKETIYLCKGVSACSCGAPNSQKHIRSLQKYVCMLLCFTGTLLATYRLPVPENGCRDFCPCWGVGRSPAGLLTLHRETVCLIQIVISGERVQGQCPCWAQGTALVQGRSSAWFPCAINVPARPRCCLQTAVLPVHRG